MVELCPLRFVEPFVADLEVCAGVDHGAVEPQGIEVVAEIIVKADRLPVARARVPLPVLRLSARGVLTRRWESTRVADHVRQLTRGGEPGADRIQESRRAHQVALDVDIAADEGLAETQL